MERIELRVTLHGRLLFATSPDSFPTAQVTEALWDTARRLRIAFPAGLGYQVSAYRTNAAGAGDEVDVSNF